MPSQTPATKSALHESETVRFVLNGASGAVHVVIFTGRPDWDTGESTPVSGEDILRLMLGEVSTVCGRVIAMNRGGLECSGHYVTRFADEALCGSCYRAVPEESRWRLFEHPRP